MITSVKAKFEAKKTRQPNCKCQIGNACTSSLTGEMLKFVSIKDKAYYLNEHFLVAT